MKLSSALDSFLTHMHTTCTQLKAQKGFSTNSWSPLSLQLSLLCYSALRIRTALVSLDYQLCLLNSESWLGSTWLPLPSMWPGNPLKTVSWDNDRVHLMCFLSLKSYCLFLLDIQLLQLSSVTQSCPTLFDPMNHSTPGLPVHHQLLESTQTHVHRVSDLIQPFSSSVIPFSSCTQSFPASGSFPMSQLFASGGPSIGVSASTSVLPMNTQD